MNYNVPIEIPSGIFAEAVKHPRHPKLTIENVELRDTLHKAADDACLNVTERMALNRKFYPYEEGFPLFPKDGSIPKFNMYYGNNPLNDTFSKEVESLKIPEDISVIQHNYCKSSKSNFQTNLDNALKKLKKVLRNDI